MRRATIEQIVERLESELGPDVDVVRLESEAVARLERVDSGPDRSTCTAPAGGLSPQEGLLREALLPEVHLQEVILQVRIDDCAGRLPATVVTHVYDKIRRLTSGLVSRMRRVTLSSASQAATFVLRVCGTGPLLLPIPDSAADVCRSIERAALDAGFDRVDLLSLSAGKGGTGVRLRPHVSELLRACPRSTLDFEIGSSRVGIRADSALSAARLLLDELRRPDEQARLVLTANARPDLDAFVDQTSHVRIDARVSVWPLLARTAAEIPGEPCYRDRSAWLARVAGAADRHATALLERLAASADLPRGDDGRGRAKLSIDDPLNGPDSAASFIGVPAATPAAAALLRDSLLSGLAAASRIDGIASDGLPLADSIRNVFAFERRGQAAGLAGFLVELFGPAVRGAYTRSATFIGADPSPREDRIHVPGFPGAVPVAGTTAAWTDVAWTEDAFGRGGAIIPPRAP